MAEYHFRRSLLINQRSSVLRCYVGVALHKIGRAADALEQLQVVLTACLQVAQTVFVSSIQVLHQLHVCKSPFVVDSCSRCAGQGVGASHLACCCMWSSLRSVCT